MGLEEACVNFPTQTSASVQQSCSNRQVPQNVFSLKYTASEHRYVEEVSKDFLCLLLKLDSAE